MGTHPIFESDFDCLTDRKWLLVSPQLFQLFLLQLLLLSSKRWPRMKLMPSAPQLIIHHVVSPPVSVPCHNGFNWDVVTPNTSALNVVPPFLLTTHQPNSQTFPTTTLSLPKLLERTQVSGTNTRT